MPVVADELRADHAGRVEAEALSVEGESPLQVVDGEGDDIDTRFH
jgi:hypothetical protein